ncbi:MAG: hypothetical protein ABSA47_12815 [Verrucomicrobiota bacterium]
MTFAKTPKQTPQTPQTSMTPRQHHRDLDLTTALSGPAKTTAAARPGRHMKGRLVWSPSWRGSGSIHL